MKPPFLGRGLGTLPCMGAFRGKGLGGTPPTPRTHILRPAFSLLAHCAARNFNEFHVARANRLPDFRSMFLEQSIIGSSKFGSSHHLDHHPPVCMNHSQVDNSVSLAQTVPRARAEMP